MFSHKFFPLSAAIIAAVLLASCAQPSAHTVAAAPAIAPEKPKVFASYGQPLAPTGGDAIPVSTVFANPEAYNHKVVRLTGTVGPVCQVKGCWMTVNDGKSPANVFIKFPDPPEGRYVPLDAPGHETVIEGEFLIAKLSEQFARHLAEDRGASAEEVQKIVGPQPVFALKNPGVRIYGIAPAAQPATPS